MAKKKAVEADHQLQNVAVAVGSALGKLAQRMGLGTPAASPAAKPPAIKRKRALNKKVVAKKVAPKPASRNTVRTAAKRRDKGPTKDSVRRSRPA